MNNTMKVDYMCAMDWVWSEGQPAPIFFAFADVDRPSNVVLIERDINSMCFTIADFNRNQQEGRFQSNTRADLHIASNFEGTLLDHLSQRLPENRNTWDVVIGTIDPVCFKFLSTLLKDNRMLQAKLWKPIHQNCQSRAIQNAVEYHTDVPVTKV